MTYRSFVDKVALPQLGTNDVPFQIDWRASRQSWPFKSMKIGESLFIEGAASTQSPLGSVAYQAARQVGKKNGWEFVGRKVEGGIRIWRLY